MVAGGYLICLVMRKNSLRIVYGESAQEFYLGTSRFLQIVYCICCLWQMWFPAQYVILFFPYLALMDNQEKSVLIILQGNREIMVQIKKERLGCK